MDIDHHLSSWADSKGEDLRVYGRSNLWSMGEE